ncbi:hypothetical protein CEUSTIGMA_g11801.t1 [Chlamydomonas eustigma]|uniref:CCHC-type domain-containing protein n=1 Tax=Chlamydomonas eustigma TaxID=1157962 RepID=A0A250XN56_9CHLO|nr:hypothetical protein CEUSTIGMA_g11801.t1 [Chlamydomonas eustigma]|eukprot:GAX84379.1 hypothetical protein CEUSTIGMA_g11801.t1 [Chlamydomonas eustigma]
MPPKRSKRNPDVVPTPLVPENMVLTKNQDIPAPPAVTPPVVHSEIQPVVEMIPAAPAINGDAIPDRVGSPSPPRPSRPTRSELEAMFHHIMRELKYTHGRLPSPSKLTHSFFKSVSDGTHGADIAARFREILRWLRKNKYYVELPTFIDDHSVHKFVSEFLENLLRTNQPLIDDELIDAVTRFVSGEAKKPRGPPEDCPLFGKEGRPSEAEKALLSEWAICWYCRKGTHMAKDCPMKKKKDDSSTLVTLAPSSLTDAIRRDWLGTTQDLRTINNGFTCADWLRGHAFIQRYSSFEKSWLSPPIFCSVTAKDTSKRLCIHIPAPPFPATVWIDQRPLDPTLLLPSPALLPRFIIPSRTTRTGQSEQGFTPALLPGLDNAPRTGQGGQAPHTTLRNRLFASHDHEAGPSGLSHAEKRLIA